ncbi:hypothetical protein M569_01405 [Genlisea aurea]|uniref:Uncharacterized protein n=1 Tax=Genlisea aurea TaxID=192259 RepID=S8D7G6_9LAMI|nr:hypothetical protein M569_01405 [Genlisea aurea]
MASLFGGRDPFDHAFFTQPFGGLFGGRSLFDDSFFSSSSGNQSGSSRQITIEELNPDGVGSNDVSRGNVPGKELSVNDQNTNTRGGFQNYSFQRVAFGGPDGIYYSSSVGKRAGDDGVFYMETKEEDKMVGESLHTISKGINNKGHSLTTKNRRDGQVDSVQTLHNLNEDELDGFEEAWQNSANITFPGWNNDFNLLDDAGDFSELFSKHSAQVLYQPILFLRLNILMPYMFTWFAGWEKNLFDDFAKWTGLAGWPPVPSLEFFGNGGMEPDGENRGQQPSNATTRKIVPID